jgi:flagellar biosynthetic protein FliO
VLGFLLAFLYALKRLTQKQGIDQCQIKLISSFSIAPRKQIMILDVFKERLVLGVTADHINCISKYQLSTDEHNTNLLKEKKLFKTDKVEEQKTLANDFNLRKLNNNPNNISQVQSEK